MKQTFYYVMVYYRSGRSYQYSMHADLSLAKESYEDALKVYSRCSGESVVNVCIVKHTVKTIESLYIKFSDKELAEYYDKSPTTK